MESNEHDQTCSCPEARRKQHRQSDEGWYSVIACACLRCRLTQENAELRERIEELEYELQVCRGQ